MPDKDKGNILNFNTLLPLAPPHCKINWPTCSNVVVVIGVGFLIDVPPAFSFYSEGLMQNSSQLVG
jgi:hypothetical protein